MALKKLKIKLIQTLENIGFVRKVFENSTLSNTQYKVVKGTIRNTPDKDDAWLFELSKHAENIYDVGCNIGQSTMLMAHNKPKKLVLIDPNPKALSTAMENLIHNGLSQNVLAYNAFVGEKSGQTVDFYTVLDGAAGSKFKSFATTANAMQSYYTVKTISLDDVLKDTGILPNLVKVDVEGAEIEVLDGSTEIAKKQSTLFFVEIHSGMELTISENTKSILDWCAKNQYVATYLKSMTNLTVDLIQNRGRYHALLVPSSMSLPAYITTIAEGSNLIVE